MVMRVTRLHDLPQQKKITRRDDFFVARIYHKKNYTNYNIHQRSLAVLGQPTVQHSIVLAPWPPPSMVNASTLVPKSKFITGHHNPQIHSNPRSRSMGHTCKLTRLHMVFADVQGTSDSNTAPPAAKHVLGCWPLAFHCNLPVEAWETGRRGLLVGTKRFGGAWSGWWSRYQLLEVAN